MHLKKSCSKSCGRRRRRKKGKKEKTHSSLKKKFSSYAHYSHARAKLSCIKHEIMHVNVRFRVNHNFIFKKMLLSLFIGNFSLHCILKIYFLPLFSFIFSTYCCEVFWSFFCCCRVKGKLCSDFPFPSDSDSDERLYKIQ